MKIKNPHLQLAISSCNLEVTMKNNQENRVSSFSDRIQKLLKAAKAGEYVTPNHVNGIPEHDFSTVSDDITVYASYN